MICSRSWGLKQGLGIAEIRPTIWMAKNGLPGPYQEPSTIKRVRCIVWDPLQDKELFLD